MTSTMREGPAILISDDWKPIDEKDVFNGTVISDRKSIDKKSTILVQLSFEVSSESRSSSDCTRIWYSQHYFI